MKLYYYGARLYDPVIGRWGTMDPLAEIHHGYNPYNYVLNNPMSYMDPLGLDTMSVNSHDDIPDSALEGDVLVDNDGTSSTLLRTVPINSTSVSLNMPNRPSYAGFTGVFEYLWTGGNEDGYKYDWDGKPIGFASIMGTPPLPGFSKFNIKDLAKFGRIVKSLIRKGRKPDMVKRIDFPKTDPSGKSLHGEQIHIHLKDGRALNMDGTWKHGGGNVPKEVLKWIEDLTN